MTFVLIVDDEPDLRRSVARELDAQGYQVEHVGSVDDALRVLDARAVDVVLTDLRMGSRDGIDLLVELRERRIDARPVLMSAFASARDSQRATELGAVRVLCKPFTPGELLEAIRHASECTDGFHGTVHGLSLVDMLQMFHLGRRSIAVLIGGRRGGTIVFQNGEIVDARSGRARGTDALLRILRKPAGTITTSPVSKVKQTIDAPFERLLLDTLRTLDETARDPRGSRPTSDAIEIITPPATVEVDIDVSFSEAVEAASKQLDAASFVATDNPQIEKTCRELVAQVDGAVAAGVVVLDAGQVLGLHKVGPASTEALSELMAEAALEMFRSRALKRLERALHDQGSARGDESFIEEVHFSTSFNLHFCKAIKGQRAVVVLVTSKGTSIGMGWALLKSAIPSIETHVP